MRKDSPKSSVLHLLPFLILLSIPSVTISVHGTELASGDLQNNTSSFVKGVEEVLKKSHDACTSPLFVHFRQLKEIYNQIENRSNTEATVSTFTLDPTPLHRYH